MELGAREILIALGVLLLLAILLDGVRRVRNSKYEKLHMSRRKQPIFDDDDEFDEYGSELPSGGARVVGYRDHDSAEQINESIRQALTRNKKVTAPFRQPEQVQLGLDADVPVLMKPVEEISAPVAQNKEVPRKPKKSVNQKNKPDKADEQTDVITLHVMAKKGQTFKGGELLDILLDQDLRFGAMKIFHRYAGEEGSGKVLFSMANAVNPGTFDLDAMEGFVTPGVTFLMILQDSEDPQHTFDLMLATAEAVNDGCDGEIKDENRSVLTRQTIEHYRQRIADYTRRQLSGSH